MQRFWSYIAVQLGKHAIWVTIIGLVVTIALGLVDLAVVGGGAMTAHAAILSPALSLREVTGRRSGPDPA